MVYDSVGKDTWRGSLKCLRLRGSFVHFGQSSGMIADFKFSDLASGGSLYATRPMLFDYIKSREELSSRAADLFGKLASGQIKAHVGQRVALRDAAAAHRELEGRRTVGVHHPAALAAILLRPSGARRPGYKLASMNAASCDFDTAPTLVATTAPFLNSIRVGMPRT